MRCKYLLCALTWTIFTFYVNNATAASSYDPSLEWYTMTTEHFYIHFHSEEESIARETALIAEKVHKKISSIFNWTPTFKTNIVLADRMDFVNGSATPLPDNRMQLYVTPPDSFIALEGIDNWMELLLTHEYTHIVHGDKALQLPGALRYLFGRIVLSFPNVFQPSFLIEGLATYFETDTERGVGRGQSSMFAMMMRKEVENGIKPFSQISLPFVSWPYRTGWYLYGVYYYQFIADTYGAKKVMELVNNQSDNIVPFMAEFTSRQTFDKTYKKMWPEFETYLRNKFMPKIDAIKNIGLHEGGRISTGGYTTERTVVLNNGNLLYYNNNLSEKGKIVLFNVNTGHSRVVTEVQNGRFDATTEFGIILAQSEIVRNTNIFMDLYHVDIDSGKQTRLTRGKRYKNAVLDPNGRNVIAVHNELGNNSLHLFSNVKPGAKLSEPIVLWQGNNKEVISQLDWSPISNQLVADVWRANAGWNIELFNLDSNSWQPLVHTDSIEGHPTFSPSGDALVFTANYGGVYNIYRLNLANGKIKQLTNLTGGGFYPALSPDQHTLYYCGYHRNGYDVYRLSLEDELDEPVSGRLVYAALKNHSTHTNGNVATEPTDQNRIAKIKPYSPWKSLASKWWAPSFSMFAYAEDFRIVGVTTDGKDALDRHTFDLELNYVMNLETIGGVFSYVYDRWDPVFALNLQREPSPLAEKNLYRVTDIITGNVILPFIRIDRQFSLQAAVSYVEENDFALSSARVAGSGHIDAPLGLAISFNSTKHYPISISDSHGHRIKFIFENSDLIKNDYRGSVYTFDWRSYFALGKQHVFALHLASGLSTGGTRAFKLGRALSEGNNDPTFNERNYALRGYTSTDNISGKNMIIGSLEYRFPLRRIERGTSIPVPVGIHQFHSAVFLDGGNAWNDRISNNDVRSAGGLELDIDAVLFYLFQFNFRLGYAKPIGPGSGLVYFGLNSSF